MTLVLAYVPLVVACGFTSWWGVFFFSREMRLLRRRLLRACEYKMGARDSGDYGLFFDPLCSAACCFRVMRPGFGFLCPPGRSLGANLKAILGSAEIHVVHLGCEPYGTFDRRPGQDSGSLSGVGLFSAQGFRGLLAMGMGPCSFFFTSGSVVVFQKC